MNKHNYEICEILIYVNNDWHFSRPCIESILKLTEIEYHITIIDDSSNDFIKNNIEKYSLENKERVSILRNENKIGNIKSINQAIKNINARFFAIVSNKSVVTKNWLKKMLNCINQNQNCGLCIPITNNSTIAQIKIPPSSDMHRLNKIIEFHSQKIYPSIPFAESHVLVLSRSLLDMIGYFDENFVGFDISVKDFSLRAKESGFEILCSDDTFIFSSDKFKKNLTDQKLFETRWNNSNNIIKKTKQKFINFKSRRSRYNKNTILHKTLTQINKEILNTISTEFKNKYPKPKKIIKKGNPLNILCILPTLSPYGGVISVINMLNHLIELGHYCTVISLSPCKNHLHLFYGEPIYIANWEDIPQKFEGNYDVLLATSWETVDPIAKIRKKSNYGQTYYFIQDLEYKFYNNDNKKKEEILATYDKIEVKFVKTNYLYKKIEKQTTNIFKIRPGMNLDLFYPHNTEENKNLTVLAMVRLGHYHRGYDLIIETLNKVSSKKPNTKFLLFGSNELNNLSVNFDYENHKVVKPENLPDLYSKADIFLEMSRHHGFGRTGVEAMACGTACVLSSSEGITEYAIDGKNALIVPVEDTKTASEKVCFLIENEEKRKNIISEGLKTVNAFSDREAAQDFLNLVYKTHPLVIKND